MYFKQEIRKWGENLACQYLEKNNYEIVEKNFKCYQGEIDIIAKDKKKNEFVFIQVKTSSDLRYGNPTELLEKQEQKYIKQAVQNYFCKNNFEFQESRFDMIEVLIERNKAKVKHIEEVF